MRIITNSVSLGRRGISRALACVPLIVVSSAHCYAIASHAPRPQEGELELRILDTDGNPLPGVAAKTAKAKDWPRLLKDLVGRWEELGIADEAMTWVRLSGERELPPVPGTQADAPFVPLEETTAAVGDANGMLALSLSDDARILLRHPDFAPALLAAGLSVNHAPLEVRLPPKGELTIRLRDGEGNPVERAFIRVERARSFSDTLPILEPWHDELRWHGPADAEGAITVTDLPAGVQLYVTPFGRFRRSPIEVTIDSQSGKAELDARIWRIGTLQGLVLDHEEQPVAGYGVAYVLSRRFVTSDRTRRVATDENGRFRFDAVIEGTGKVLFGVPTTGMFNLGSSFEEREAEVFADWTTTLDPLILAPPATIEGRVLGPALGTRPYVVQIWRDGRTFERAICDEAGRFSLEVPEGEYGVGVSTNSWFPATPLALATVRAPAQGVQLDLRGVAGGIGGTLTSQGPLEATTAPHRPTHCVRLFSADASRQEALKTMFELPFRPGAGSDFAIEGLPSGRWNVRLLSGEGRAWVSNIEVLAGQSVELGGLDLAPAEVTGHLLDKSGAPVGGGEVTLIHLGDRRSTNKRKTLTGADGSYAFDDVPAGWIWVYAASESMIATTVEAEVQGGESARHDLTLEDAASLEGVLTMDGEPVADADVHLSFPAPTSIKAWVGPGETKTDEEGRFQLTPLLPGTYELSVRPPSPLRYRYRMGLGERVSLRSGHTETVTITLPPAPVALSVPEVSSMRAAIDYVRVIPLDGPEEWRGRRIIAAEIDERKFSAYLPGRTHLACARIDEQALYGILEEASDTELELLPSSGAIEIPTSLFGHSQPPRLRLLSVRGHAVPASVFSDGTEPTRIDGRLRFPFIPFPSRIRLTWDDGHGREQVRDFDYEGPDAFFIEEL